MLFPLIGSIFANMAVIVISAENIYLPRDLSDAGIVNFSDHLNGRIGNILWGLALLSSAQSSCVTTTYTGQVSCHRTGIQHQVASHHSLLKLLCLS